jgi:hypothetical protein
MKTFKLAFLFFLFSAIRFWLKTPTLYPGNLRPRGSTSTVPQAEASRRHAEPTTQLWVDLDTKLDQTTTAFGLMAQRQREDKLHGNAFLNMTSA